MSDEKKFILCPNCGAILEKGIVFCSYCGANIEEKKKNGIQSTYPAPTPAQPSYTTQQDEQTRNQYQRGIGQRSIYDSQDQEYMFGAEMEKRLMAESKIRQATIFSYLALCIPLISIIFLIITIIFAIQAKRILGRWDSRIIRALIIAVIGTVIDYAVNIFFYIQFF
ncbi:MAG: zinc ribbon domain-containing protein, partial [Asgard group archaeon]|nr:zinc ribbon domain-containing protein [Asgard group archaeon]